MIMKSAKLQELQDFCNKQFDSAQGENATLLSADEVKRLTQTRDIANQCVDEYNELAKNYQELLKDYREAIKHTSTPVKTEEVNEPAGKVREEKFDMKKFKEDFLAKHKEEK